MILVAQVSRTFTPDFASSLEASSASKGAGMGTTGRSLVEMPRCWRDMCECSEFLDLATVPQRTQRYPGHTYVQEVLYKEDCLVRAK